MSQEVYVQDRNVEPDKISRIIYLIMFWSVTSRSSNGKWTIAWENLSFGLASLKKQVDLSYANADPEVWTPPPLENHKF